MLMQLPASGPERATLLRALVDAEAVATLEANAITTTGLPAEALDTLQRVDDATASPAASQKPVPSWGLDRVDGVMNDAYNFVSTGAGVCAYILDTGVKAGHPNFEQRMLQGAFVSFSTDNPGQETDDFHGHGTHTVRLSAFCPSCLCYVYPSHTQNKVVDPLPVDLRFFTHAYCNAQPT